MLNETARFSAWVVGACLLALGCQAFASKDSDTFGPRTQVPMSFVPAAPPSMGPVSISEPVPRPPRRDDDAGSGTAASPDAAPFEDAGSFQDAAADASPAAGDAG